MAVQRDRIAGWAWAAAVVLIVVGIVGAYLVFQPSPPHVLTDGPVNAAPQTLEPGRDYYLFVRLVEFKPHRPNGDKWDSGGSAPDARVKLFWQDQLVFELPQREDQLIAAWDTFRVDVKELVLGDGQMDVASMVNGPIVRIGPDQAVTIEVWDDDTISSDLALRLSIPLADLREGPNQIAVPADSGVVRLRIDLVDHATPLPKLIELETQRG